MKRGIVLLLALMCVCGGASRAMAQAGAESGDADRVDQVRAMGSLRGTDLDGDWAPPRLRADPALLRRFDHLLSALGEVDLRDLRPWIGREVAREQGADAAARVLSAWDDYIAVLRGVPSPGQQPGSNAGPDPALKQAPANNPAAPAPPAPYDLLTPNAPATAALQRDLHERRVARFGAEAAVRLRAEDLVRWRWARRLEAARARVKTLPEAEREPYLAQTFSGAELLRARTLLGQPP